MRDGAIALLDVLGWKGVWQRSESAIDDLLSISADARDRVQRILNDSNADNELKERFSSLTPEVLTFSDTLAFAVHGDHGPSIELCALLAIGAIHRSLELKLPVRGAITYGKFLARQNILVGPAVDEVASWYEHSEWIGVHLTPSASLPIVLDSFYVADILTHYDVPTKTGTLKGGLACNWPQFIPEGGDTMGTREALIQSLMSLGPVTSDLGRKVLSTVDFYDAIRGKKG